MIERRKFVAHVVNERRDDEFVVRAVLSRAGRGLQGMLEARHRVAAQ
jgi:hypothetical protein